MMKFCFNIFFYFKNCSDTIIKIFIKFLFLVEETTTIALDATSRDDSSAGRSYTRRLK